PTITSLHPLHDALPISRQFGARVHAFAANRGKGHALLAGFRMLADYDAVVTLDADGQHPPECFPEFVNAGVAGGDLVLGARARRSEEHTSELQSPDHLV